MPSVQKDWERLTLLLARAVRDINEDRCIGGTDEIRALSQKLCDHSGRPRFRYIPLGGRITVCGTCGIDRPEVQP